ncbi:MAG: hypothetical protein PHQ74_13010 [Crocinitomicaceae bacterium]|nr:hypothetical protein [Crocinitomicaceae bacterium]
MVKRGLYILIFAISFFEVDLLFAQGSELDISKKGSKLFSTEQYVAATPLYLQLLALQPRSTEYNYKYGACLLYNSTNRKTAIKYLDFATTKPDAHPDAFYFMGKAYHLNYQFEKAISFYQEYKVRSKKDFNPSWEVDRQIQSCKNGLSLLRNVSDIVVFEKKSVLEASFYNAYDLANIGGDILISDSDQSKVDKKKGHRPLIFFPKEAKRVYFGSYGESEASGTDIYYKEKNPDGTWSKPTLVQGGVNSDFDEDYPYMDVQSGYLYFSSKGHNSMGGFDIFKAKYNEATNTFGKPENLDFAVSSTDNDMLYIKDDSGEFAWFASSRQSKDGKMDVYKVKIERVGSPIAAASGAFNSIVRPQNKSFNIEVKEVSSNKIIGTFYSDEKGFYLISFPKSGKYEYAVSIFGSPHPFKQIVDVPNNNDVTLLKQQIVHLVKGGQEMIEIINVDDGNVADRSAILADVMNAKAELNPNATLFNSTKVEKPAEVENALVDLGMNKMSAEEAVNNTQDLIANYKYEKANAEALQQKSLHLIANNAKQIDLIQQELKKDVEKTESNLPEAEKVVVLKQAAAKVNKISELDTTNKELLNYANSLQKTLDALKLSSTDLTELQQKLQNAQEEGDDLAYQEIAHNAALIRALQEQSKKSNKENLQADIAKLEAAQQKDKEMIKMYQTNVNVLDKELKILADNKATAKGTKATDIQTEIDSKKNELELIQNEIKKNQEKERQKQVELNTKFLQVSLNRLVSEQEKPKTRQSLANVEHQVKNQNVAELNTLKTYVNQQIGSKNIATNSETQNQKTEVKSNPELAASSPQTERTTNSESKTEKPVQESNQIPAEEKTKAPENFGLTHQTELAKIQANSALTPKQKGEAILKAEIELQTKLDASLAETNKVLSTNPADEKAKEQVATLKKEKVESEKRLAEQTVLLVNAEAKQMNPENLLSKVDANYVKDIQAIENASSKTKVNDLIDRENQVQTLLKKQIATNTAASNQTNGISLQAENQVINKLIETSEKRVKSLETQAENELANAASQGVENNAQKDAFRNRVLATNVGLLKSDFNSDTELNKQQNVLNEYLKALETRLEDLRTQDRTNPPPGISNDIDWTVSELDLVEKKLASVSNKLISLKDVAKAEANKVEATKVEEKQVKTVEPKEMAAAENTPASTQTPASSKSAAPIGEFRSRILAEKASLLTSQLSSEIQITEQQKELKNYQDALESRLVELSEQEKINSTPELQKELNWTMDELETVEEKLTSVSKQLIALNALANKEDQKNQTVQNQASLADKTPVKTAINVESDSVNQAKNAIANNSVPSEKTADLNAFRTEKLGGKTNLLTSELNSEVQLSEQQKGLTDYLEALEDRLSDLRVEEKTNASPALQADLNWTLDELDKVEAKLTSVSAKLNAFDDVANTEVQEPESNKQDDTKTELKPDLEAAQQANLQAEVKTNVGEPKAEIKPVEKVEKTKEPIKAIAQKDAFRTEVLAGNVNLLTSDFSSETQLTKQQNELINYLDALESRLVDLRVEENTSSTPALQADLKWTLAELQTVEAKLGSVSKKLIAIADVANTEVPASEIIKQEVVKTEVKPELEVAAEAKLQAEVSANVVEPLAENKPVEEIEKTKAPVENVSSENAFRTRVLAENANLLTLDLSSETQLTEQQDKLTDYLDALESRLVEVRVKDKKNSTPQTQKDLDWTLDELEAVEEKLASVSSQLIELHENELVEAASNEIAQVETQKPETQKQEVNKTEVKTAPEVKVVPEEKARPEIKTKVETETANQTVNQAETKTPATVPTENTAQKDAFRKRVLAGNANLLTSEFNSETLLTQQQNELNDYQEALDNRLIELRNQEQINASPATQSDINWTLEELKMVDGKLKSVANKMNSLKEVANAEVQGSEQTIDKSEAQAEEKETNISTENLVTLNPKVEIQEIKSVKTVQQLNRENQQTAAVLKLSPGFANELLLKSIETKNNKLTQEATDIAKIKDNELKSKMLTKLYQEQLVVKEQLAELERDQSYAEVTQSSKNSANLKVSELETVSKLENKQRRFYVEIGELTSVTEELEKDIAKLNKRKAKPLILELNEKQELLAVTKSALIEVEKELAVRKTKMPELVNAAIALKQPITLETENNVARSQDYKQIQASYKEIVEVNSEIKKVQAQVEAKRKEIETVINKSQVSEQRLPLAFVEQKLAEVIALNESIPAIEQKRNGLQETFNQNLNQAENTELIQNLLVRGVASITEIKPKTIPFKEFKIIPQQEQAARQVIVLDEAKTSGLLYRVQVGAFSKPINENLFTEFTPVSGEKLNNGITRYMVGYFFKRDVLQTALDKIKKIGYADAFPVAYCDGERISIAEARRLEEAGLCLPKGLDQLEIEVIETEESPLANQTVRTNTDVEMANTNAVQAIPNAAKESLAAYNKAPGAAVADAVETRLGLFFTVQVGVFNKPVPASQLFDIEPLITQRLENGQVRYSTGIFHTIAETKPKKEEAIVLGIADAFVTAYYQGNRISIQEALELLKVKDQSILEPVKVVENKVLTEEQLLVVEQQKMEEEEIKIEKVKDNLENSNAKVQLVSKKQFETFPLDEIKRYNQKGEFYYDAQDKRVKSIIYNAPDMPSIYGFRNEMDTLLIRKKSRQEVSEELVLTVTYQQKSLPGNIGDWLLRFGYLREVKVMNDQIQLTVYGINDPIDYEFVLSDLQSLGFVQVPKKQE